MPCSPRFTHLHANGFNAISFRLRRETTVIFDLGRSPNVVGGGRALGEEKKGIFAVLPAQKRSSSEGAEPAPRERNLFSFDSLQLHKTS